MEERARELAEADALVRRLIARHEARRAATEAHTAERQRQGAAERVRLTRGEASVADLGRAARHFEALDAALVDRRREEERAWRALGAGLAELARAKTELAREHAELEVVRKLLSRRALREQLRDERSVEEAAEDAHRARPPNEGEGIS